MIAWIADLRSRIDDPDHVDPDVAERLILWAFGKADLKDLAARVINEHQSLLAAYVVTELQLDAAAVDSHLERTRGC